MTAEDKKCIAVQPCCPACEFVRAMNILSITTERTVNSIVARVPTPVTHSSLRDILTDELKWIDAATETVSKPVKDEPRFERSCNHE